MASGPAVGGDDGAKEIKVYKRKAFKAPKKNVAKNSTVETPIAAAENNIAATTKKKSDNDSSNQKVTANTKEVSENLQQPELPESEKEPPKQEEEARLQTLSDDHVDSVRKAEEEAQLRTQSAEDVNLETETEQQLQIRAAEGPEPEQEQQLQTLTAEDVDLAIETEPQLQEQASEDVNSVPEPVQERLLQTLIAENVNLAIETEPQLQARASEDANLVPEPEQELQLLTLAAEDANSVPELEQELQSQTLAAEDVSLGREPEREPQLQVIAYEDANTDLEPGPVKEPQLLIQAAADVNPVQQQLVSRPDMVVDDSSSLNQQQMPTPSAQEPGNGPVKQGLGRVRLNFGSGLGSKFGSGSKQELRRKLEIELDNVRKLVKRIEAKEGEIVSGLSRSHVSANEVVINGANRVHSAVALESINRETTRPLNHLNVSVLVNGQGVMSDNVEKEKRTPKANPLYRNSEFLLAKDKFPPADSNKKSKLNGKKHGRSELGNGFGMGAKFSKSCSSLLEKLMKHKHGWVFNVPVDAKALLLHDYHIIIKHPMDLGTVKSRLNKNWYKSPKEFAEDVRLTFSNAMTYNPKGQDVHVMAEQLSKIFEDRWAIIESDYNREMRFHQDYESSLPTPTSRYVPLPLPLSLTRPSPLDMRRIIDRSESFSHSFDPKLKPTSTTPSSRTPAPKKPKAKDPNKRDMTYEEKQKLSTNLQSLPSEKLDNIVQIIKKRNSAVLQQDDEIEVDIDRVDAETLWELDRFVTNYKKGLSKNKRKAELAIQAIGGSVQNVQGNNPPSFVAAPSKEIRIDNRNDSASSPVQGAREGDNASGSSSSSSSSSDSGSSSSDSDSDSSSASGSDAEQSPGS